MENLVNADFWRDRRVLLTGHTGFKGGWLGLWLQSMGAQVTGLALTPNTKPNFFEATHLGDDLESRIADIRDLKVVEDVARQSKAEIVFHLAAQPLVRDSYRDPVGTFATNIMGTVHVLEACRLLGDLKALVCITTDKVYANNESNTLFHEEDRLGGRDPYSSSKAACELVIDSYRRCFYEQGAMVASARAGNVIGGGDWSSDRLVPDIVRAVESRQNLQIRHPESVRPWQHVIEPIAGYLLLAQALATKQAIFAGAFNFGPNESDCVAVEQIVQLAQSIYHERLQVEYGKSSVYEAKLLRLDNRKAWNMLNWAPKWNVSRAMKQTLDWYQAAAEGANMREFSLMQIRDWERNT